MAAVRQRIALVVLCGRRCCSCTPRRLPSAARRSSCRLRRAAALALRLFVAFLCVTVSSKLRPAGAQRACRHPFCVSTHGTHRGELPASLVACEQCKASFREEEMLFQKGLEVCLSVLCHGERGASACARTVCRDTCADSACTRLYLCPLQASNYCPTTIVCAVRVKKGFCFGKVFLTNRKRI